MAQLTDSKEKDFHKEEFSGRDWLVYGFIIPMVFFFIIVLQALLEAMTLAE